MFERVFSKFIGSLDIGSVFTNILLKEIIKICSKDLFENNDIAHGLKKVNLKMLDHL